MLILYLKWNESHQWIKIQKEKIKLAKNLLDTLDNKIITNKTASDIDFIR